MLELAQVRKRGFRPTVVCCLLCKKKILLLHKKEYSLWLVPQGKIKLAETLEEALFRELTEELGADFVSTCEPNVQFVGEASAEFFPKDVDPADIEKELGKGVEMKGKHYYFLAIECKKNALAIKQTQFDDYFWLEYEGARRLLNLMRQKKKKEILLQILDLLKTQGLIK